MASYLAESKDAFPYLATWPRLDDAFEMAGVLQPYFGQSVAWPTAAARGWAAILQDRPQLCPSWFASNATTRADAPVEPFGPGTVTPASYWLSYTLFTSPAMWTRGERDVQASDLRATLLSDVAFPSSKGELVEVIPWHRTRMAPGIWDVSLFRWRTQNAPFVAVYVDGSAEARGSQRLLEPSPQTPRAWAPAPILCTTDGAAGRDR